ncbi:MOSC domain-containing protein [Alcanivorax sp. 1008]|uniref:MOSC domain-containing protein n=1 Tax=Alcanivorax sp. 1008 TaxID=2816853 RepID=UPI001E117FB7|nr:MOSC N-terminal beta barrel domain-containing protein [Alcanivorax sp. 1008]MCC1495231.1 MOSC domain-containing protein [Alcanivorax sp. 1008]
MIEVGTVKELWRYPVKSMEGTQLEEGIIGKEGMLGDRNWALRDESVGELTTVRKMPKLLKFRVAYDEEPSIGKVPHITIGLPDGLSVSSSDENINEKLSDAIGKPVSLWPLQPKTNLKHYRLKVPAGAAAMKKQFATKELPDMSSVTWRLMMELAIFATPLGRYHDVYPLHLLTTSSLEKLKQLEPDGDFCTERFRPNLVIDTGADNNDFEEFQWVEGKLYIGDTILKVVSRTVRCSMPAQPQVTIKKDAKVLRTLEAHTQRHLGVNISVIKPGIIRVGDAVRLEPSNRSDLFRRFDALSSRLRNRAIQSSFKLIDRLNKQS